MGDEGVKVPLTKILHPACICGAAAQLKVEEFACISARIFIKIAPDKGKKKIFHHERELDSPAGLKITYSVYPMSCYSPWVFI